MDIANRTPTRLALDLLAPRDGERVLDAGCGTGAVSRELLRRAACDIDGVDWSPAMLHRAQVRLGLSLHNEQSPRVNLHLAHLSSLPFPPGQFDAVLALNILYFCDNDGAMLRELRRMLRPGGRLVAYVTDRSTMQGWAFVRHGTHRLFDRHEVTQALIAGGFAPEDICVMPCAITRRINGILVRATV